jgi:hypothetical protein
VSILPKNHLTDTNDLSANVLTIGHYGLSMRKALLLSLFLVLALPQNSYAASKTVTGAFGQSLTASATSVSNNGLITVTGKRFDESVGIYLAICVVPKKGLQPTPCGGGVNKAGVGEGSFWISSNPPPYGIGLADPFQPGGRFTYQIRVSKQIGKFDCTKVKCAITVRADHLRSEDRSFDLYLPITLK